MLDPMVPRLLSAGGPRDPWMVVRPRGAQVLVLSCAFCSLGRGIPRACLGGQLQPLLGIMHSGWLELIGKNHPLAGNGRWSAPRVQSRGPGWSRWGCRFSGSDFPALQWVRAWSPQAWCVLTPWGVAGRDVGQLQSERGFPWVDIPPCHPWPLVLCHPWPLAPGSRWGEAGPSLSF